MRVHVRYCWGMSFGSVSLQKRTLNRLNRLDKTDKHASWVKVVIDFELSLVYVEPRWITFPLPSSIPASSSVRSSGLASDWCSFHVSPLSLLNTISSLSFPRMEPKWGISTITGLKIQHNKKTIWGNGLNINMRATEKALWWFLVN